MLHYQLSQQINVRDEPRNTATSWKKKCLHLFILIILKSSFNDNEIIYRGFWICLLKFMLHHQRWSAVQKYLIVQNTGIWNGFEDPSIIFKEAFTRNQKVYYKIIFLKISGNSQKIYLCKSLRLRIWASKHEICLKKENPAKVFSSKVLNVFFLKNTCKQLHMHLITTMVLRTFQ